MIQGMFLRWSSPYALNHAILDVGENEEIFAGKEQSAINLAPWDIKDDLFHKYFLRN